MCVHMLGRFSRVWLFGTPWTVTRQPMGFPRQEYWSRLPFPPPGDLPHPGAEPTSPVAPALQEDSLPLSLLPACGCSVAQSCPTLCYPMCSSTPAFPVLHHLLELVHWVSDAIQPLHPPLSPPPPAFSLPAYQHSLLPSIVREPQQSRN